MCSVHSQRGMIVLYLCAQLAVQYTDNCLDRIRGMIVLYLCAQLAVQYTDNCLLILIYYRLGQNQQIINKYAVLSRYSLCIEKRIYREELKESLGMDFFQSLSA